SLLVSRWSRSWTSSCSVWRVSRISPWPSPGLSAPITVLVACSIELRTDIVCDPLQFKISSPERAAWNRVSRLFPVFRCQSVRSRNFLQNPAGSPQQERPSARYRVTTNLEDSMTTSSGHTSAILASRVKGTAVYDGSGDKIGTVEDVVLDKTSNRIMFAALGFGGVLGMGEKYCPVPWSLLNYDENKGGYVVPLTKDRLKTAPAYELKDLTKHDGSAGDSLGDIREETYSYYNINRDWQ